MPSIKAIDVRSIHQIQSGQVIVDLCSVVKELVENSLDAGATSIDVRFKDHGLQAIEVQDNGDGISSDSYEVVALKHYTSKLSTYADLSSLRTFGFRGEALSSLCALSNMHIVTARADEAPKGSKLEFEISGKLKRRSVVASQKGTTVVVERIFGNLPVRRKELEKNIKREYNKVLGILGAYACISTDVKFSVSNHMLKGKKTTVFSTKSNPTTRENIANVFGSKTLTALLPLDLKLELQPTLPKWGNIADEGSKEVRIVGHISRPIVGEGRQTPDRQMFFVNSRPCGQPQVAKAFNEVYKSYNISQSPFIFADLRLDENSYDVNVSPDKRTILLHDQNALLESLKESLIELFESTDQTVPFSQGPSHKLPAFKQLTINHPSASRGESLTQDSRDLLEGDSGGGGADDEIALGGEETNDSGNVGLRPPSAASIIGGRALNPTRDFFDGKATGRSVQGNGMSTVNDPKGIAASSRNVTGDAQTKHVESDRENQRSQENENRPGENDTPVATLPTPSNPFFDFNQRVSEREGVMLQVPAPPISLKEKQDQIPSAIPSTPHRHAGVVQSAFDRMRPKRVPADTATITIGSKTISSPIGSPAAKRQRTMDLGSSSSSPIGVMKIVRRDPSRIQFSRGLRSFTALNSQQEEDEIETRAPESSENEEDSSSGEGSPDADAPMDTGERHFREDENYSEPLEGEEDPRAASNEESLGEDYLDEEAKRAIEEAKVQRMIQIAEEAARPPQESTKRAGKLPRNKRSGESTTQLVRTVDTSIDRIDRQLAALNAALEELRESKHCSSGDGISNGLSQTSAEERLSLIVSKEDFAHMRIVGQFNLGFIIATRPARPPRSLPSDPLIEAEKYDDELFIIDQHASDEKYNFERLQAETIVQNQRLVKPRTLELTAVEEEIIIEHQPALVKNGFLVDVDPDLPPGKRCKLVSLPMSRGVVFDHRDLEELIALLIDAPTATIPRPSKVRRMFAMRACRSSIMIGRTLTLKQMQTVLKHMGEIDKPWNCPHGRPTMRHLMGMRLWEGWEEGDGVVGVGNEGGGKVDWQRFVGKKGVAGGREREEVGGWEEEERREDEEEDEDEQHAEADEEI